MECPDCSNPLEIGAVECGCGWRREKKLKEGDEPDRQCPIYENDVRCPLTGTILENGAWHCSTHFWKMKGYTKFLRQPRTGRSWRERWYAERGLPYEPPRIMNCQPFQCVGIEYGKIDVTALRMREPGEEG